LVFSWNRFSFAPAEEGHGQDSGEHSVLCCCRILVVFSWSRDEQKRRSLGAWAPPVSSRTHLGALPLEYGCARHAHSSEPPDHPRRPSQNRNNPMPLEADSGIGTRWLTGGPHAPRRLPDPHVRVARPGPVATAPQPHMPQAHYFSQSRGGATDARAPMVLWPFMIGIGLTLATRSLSRLCVCVVVFYL
jgi:hypothetical protein